MSCPKYRCPKCGSTDVVFAEESVTKRRFKLKRNGEPYKTAYETQHFWSDTVVEYLECSNCFEDCHLEDGVELKKWENPQYRN